MADSARIAIKGDNSDLKGSLDQSVNMFEQFGSKIKSAIVLIGAAIAAKKVFDFGAAMVSEAMEAEKGVAQLEFMIDKLGDKAQLTKDQVLAFGDSVRDLTGFSGDAAVEAQTLFMRLGALDGKNIQRATMAAADLATVMKTDLSSAATKLTAVMKDPERALGSFKQAGIEFSAEQETMIKQLVKTGDEASAIEIILGTLENKIGGAAEAAGDTAAGKFQILSERLGDMGENIGTAVLPILQDMVPVFEELATFVETTVVPAIVNIIGKFQEWGGMLADYVAPVFTWFLDVGVTAFSGLQTAVENLKTTAEFALTGLALAVVKTYEGIKHFFVDALPQYLSWFGRNWMNIFTDIATGTVTIFENLWKNIKSLWDGIMSFLTGGEFTFNATPLLEGFKAVTEELPKIAERAKSNIEKKLEINLGDLGGQLKGAFDKNLKANRKAAGLDNEGPQAPSAPALTDVAKGNDAAKLAAEEKGKAAVDKAEKEAEAKKSKDKDKGASASFEDLAGLSQRIAAAAASTKEDKAVEATKETGEKQVAAIDELADIVKDNNRIAQQQLDAMKGTKDAVEKSGALT